MCEMIVIDPMHNLFLGLVKTHFYLIWVKLKILRKTKELATFHSMLQTFVAPTKLGRLPHLVGEPAGGSLTSDQWMLLATVVAPMLLPQLWSNCEPDPNGARLADRRERIASLLEKRKRSKAAGQAPQPQGTKPRKQKRTKKQTADPSQPPRRSSRPVVHTERWMNMDLEPDDDGAVEIPEDDVYLSEEDDSGDEGGAANPSMHPRDLSNFLKLSHALRLLLVEELTVSDIAAADRLLREYCTELLELYGPGVIKPNHHYATHTGDFALNYGPLREFWTFVFERLNKILKSFKTNNHDGGELECTFLREFHRTAELHRLLAEGLRDASADCVREGCKKMVQASVDIRGTVQQFAQDVENAYIDGGITLQLSPRASHGSMELELYSEFTRFLRRTHPLQAFCTVLAPYPPAGSLLIRDTATFFDYVIISGHRYIAAQHSTSSSPRDSLALVRTSGPSGATRTWVAEVQHILLSESPAHLFASVKWLRPVSPDVLATSPWGPFAQDFELRLWQYGSHLQSTDAGPAGAVIDVGDILCPVVRHSVTVGGTLLWLTLPVRTIPCGMFSPSSGSGVPVL
ncbi:hypothetical protein C8T65DRAFT_835719 [Cerioporus squamosus]|nr:hypothetical protein C8T65DRAFT_835719 [Cerioporus squamosus]